MLEIRHLRVLRAVATEGSVTAAAEALGFTASAVSQQLATLGRLVGQPVIRKEGRGVVLTPAGATLVAHAEHILASVALAESEARGTGGDVGVLPIASFATAARHLLVPAARTLRHDIPGLQLAITEAEPEVALPLLSAGAVDAALVYSYDLLPLEPAAITLFPLVSEPLVLICTPEVSAQLAAHIEDPARLLRSLPWIAGPAGSADHETTRRLCALLGFEPRIVHAAEDYSLIVSLASAGLGVAFVPLTVIEEPVAETATVRLPQIAAARHVWFAVRAAHERRQGLAALLAAIRTAAVTVKTN